MTPDLVRTSCQPPGADSIMASPSPHGVARFDWAAVDCFVRPQVVLCDEIADGYGLLFLFLLSLYRTWGLDGYFADRDKQHFSFASCVMRDRLDLQFALTRLPDKRTQHQALIDALGAGARLLVPANIRPLPYFREQHGTDQAHYFIVTGHDATTDSYRIYDNLHVDRSTLARDYQARAIRGPEFRSLVDLYWDTHVDTQRLTSHREPTSWFLQVTPGPAFDRRQKPDLGAIVVREYRRVLARFDDSRLLHVDDRNLRYLAHAVGLATVESLRAPIRAYLAEANLALVHLTLMSESLGSILNCRSPLAAEIDAYRRTAAGLRTQVLVMCLAGDGKAADWNGVRGQLVQLAQDMKAGVATWLNALGTRWP